MNKILIIGACGQLGAELTAALRKRYGAEQVIAADLGAAHNGLTRQGPYVKVDVQDRIGLHALIIQEKISDVYHMAATPSPSWELHPLKAWDLKMRGLLHVLEVAKTENLRVFWPSSVAVFGGNAPKVGCPQHTITQPSTAYGISKLAGELWCQHYHEKYGVDVRSIRYPGLIGHLAEAGSGTMDYAIDIFLEALKYRQYTCYLKSHMMLPMMYMPDAVRAAMELMAAKAEQVKVRTSYNLSGFSFSPEELAAEITRQLPSFKIDYRPDFRQRIAEGWPGSVDDICARKDWGWQPQYCLSGMVEDMLLQLQQKSTV